MQDPKSYFANPNGNCLSKIQACIVSIYIYSFLHFKNTPENKSVIKYILSRI